MDARGPAARARLGWPHRPAAPRRFPARRSARARQPALRDHARAGRRLAHRTADRTRARERLRDACALRNRQAMDEITKEVKSLYSQYPFPNSEYQLSYILKILHYFARLPAPAGKSSFFEGAAVLDVGCGTGTTITLIARMQPKAEALGVDLT